MRTVLRAAAAALLLALSTAAALGQAAPQPHPVTATLRADKPGATISKYLYGQFSEHLGRCIYEGIWVGPDSKIPNTNGYRSDTLAAIKDLQVPLLRWPGGCFADEYHWKDGIGPRNLRPKLVNNHWGGVTEDNSFGTHEFLDYCEMIGAEPYIALNIGSGTVQEMMEWVEYITHDGDAPMANLRRKNGRDKPWKVKFWGVGNEAWGCGGNMRPEAYADEYRKYATFIKAYADNKPVKIACGPAEGDLAWTDGVLKVASKNNMGGIALHYYTLPTGSWSGSKGSATQFDEASFHLTLERTFQMEKLINAHLGILDKYDPAKKIPLVIDEWGTWYDVEPGTNPGFLYQQNTLRDALVAGVNLHIFQNHADRISIACIAQMINVLQSMILTDKEKMLLTPTYHVFHMYKVHQDATMLPIDLQSPVYISPAPIQAPAAGAGSPTDLRFSATGKIPAVTASASRDKAGLVHISLVNTDANRSATVTATLEGVTASTVTGKILTAPDLNAHNTFAAPTAIQPVAFTNAKIADGKLTINLPAKSVVVLELK